MGSFATRFQSWLIKIKCLTPWENLEYCFKNVLRTFSSSCFILTKNKLQRKNTYFSKWTMYKTKKHFFLGIYSQNLNKYQCQLRQGIYEWKLDFPLWLMLRIKSCAHGFNWRQRSWAVYFVLDSFFKDQWTCLHQLISN